MNRLSQVLRALDDDALTALANRGLLRRAEKDLAAWSRSSSARPELTWKDNRVAMQWDEHSIEIHELPSRSTCSCPATGICRHILAGLLYLRDREFVADAVATETDHHAATQPTSASPAPATDVTLPTLTAALGDLSDDQLRKWAGLPTLRKAKRLLASDPPIELDTEPTLVVRFVSLNVTCRWLPASGPEGMTCSCKSETACQHAVAAILAYQISLGRRELIAAAGALEAAPGTPRTRAEVLNSVGDVLREMVTVGLSRLAGGTAQRLTTLGVSAHGVDLPRLEGQLKSLAHMVENVLKRNAQASTNRLLMQMAQLDALQSALRQKSSASLVGEHRSRYDEVGQLNLMGLGARQWSSASGYRGLTLYFWNETMSNWATWSDVRPADQTLFVPLVQYGHVGPWEGSDSIRLACRRQLRLTGAWRNRQGRLSGRPSTRATIQGNSKPDDCPVRITRWAELAQQARTYFASGLDGPRENDDIVLVTPAHWGAAQYDSLRQHLLRPLFDSEDRLLELWLPFLAENEAAVRFLERYQPGNFTHVLGLLRLVEGRVRLEPIMVYDNDVFTQLNLDTNLSQNGSAGHEIAASPAGGSAPSSPEDRDDEATWGDDTSDLAWNASTALSRYVISAQAELEGMAESGIMATRPSDVLAGAATRLEQLALTVVSRPIHRLLEQVAATTRRAEPAMRREAAEQLLRAYYILNLSASQAALDHACQNLE